MRRTSYLALAGAITCLVACGSSAPPLVFDSTTPGPATTTTIVAVAGPTVVPVGPTTAPATTTTVRPVASTGQVPPSTSPSPTTTSAGNASIGGSGTDASTTSTSLAPTTTAGTLTACDEPACSGAQLVAYPSLLGVPQLGVDPVQGSGCGLADEFGESVPDGLWFGLVYPDGNSMNFDVICVYYGDSARAKRAPAEQEAFFPVNVGTRERAVPLAPDFVWRQGVTTPDGSCTDTGPAGDADWSSASGGTAAWINVSGGVVTGAVAMCPV